MNIPAHLADEFNLPPGQINNLLSLLEEGATVPFIARYRKERTGDLNEEQIRAIAQKNTYYSELDTRRTVILATVREQGKLTPDLERKIQNTLSKTELEDLYLPYRPKRSTRASKAKAAGLIPLAQWLATLTESDADLNEQAKKYLKPDQGYSSCEEVLQGASDILAEEYADDAEIRKWLRKIGYAESLIISKVRKSFVGQKTKFQMYYEFKEKINRLPSHRILAMLRGEKEKILNLKIDFPEAKIFPHLVKHFIKHPQSSAATFLCDTVNGCLQRLLLPATESELRRRLRETAEAEAIKVFGANLRELLLAPPAGQKPVLGIDPGFRTGCKLAAMDGTGRFMDYQAVFPHSSSAQKESAGNIIIALLQKHKIELIAIGNGTAGRETELFVREILKKIPEQQRPLCLLVSEAGASVYSASKIGIEEFPELDITVRGAISIGRRLQDPLSELVKIEPRSIGVGQYQHDVNSARLQASLGGVVESCVNHVGVNLNLASLELLKYVSGLNRKKAAAVVAYRDKNGVYTSRSELLKVTGMGSKTYEQAAGFLRIPDVNNPLDDSAVHPESYDLVQKMADSLGLPLDRLIRNPELIKTIPKETFVSASVGLPTINDILAELEKPGRDPREVFQYAHFSEYINTIADLETGMRMEGIITNVTNFGAFVDIGVHQDGLVHISQLADHYVSDPKKVVKVGQVVKVKVLQIDEELKRISLTLKTS